MRKQEAGSRKQGWIEGPTADAGAPQDFNRFVPSLLPASCFLTVESFLPCFLLPASCFLTVESFLPCFLLPVSCFLLWSRSFPASCFLIPASLLWRKHRERFDLHQPFRAHQGSDSNSGARRLHRIGRVV